MSDLSINIGRVRLDNPLIMAPMAGVTNLPFRILAREHGAALTVTEMVSAVGLAQRGPKTMKLMRTSPALRPFCVQLFGYDPEAMAKGAVLAEEAGADIIDLNMGCPARKVVRHGSGSALLKDFSRIEAILKAVRLATTRPLTVKTRAGWRPGEGDVLALAPILADCGVDAVTLHPRFGIQGFSGQADWEIIASFVKNFPGPVIGNGDVTGPEDVRTMIETTGCRGVMIGRAAMGNPWLFGQSLDLLAGRPVRPPDLETRFAAAARHALMLKEHVGSLKATYMLRSVLMWYTKGLPDSASFRGSINQIKDFGRLMDSLDAYFDFLAGREKTEAMAG